MSYRPKIPKNPHPIHKFFGVGVCQNTGGMGVYFKKHIFPSDELTNVLTLGGLLTMRTWIFIPPVSSGGARVLAHLAGMLPGLGFETVAVVREGQCGTPDTGGVERVDLANAKPVRGDLWLVPEGWPTALGPGLNSGATCVAYVQNWAYVFSALPDGVDWRQLPVSFLAVSQPVAYHLERFLGASAPILRPALDTVFTPASKPDGPLTVAYMPRKNKPMVERTRELTEALGLKLRWMPIDGLPPQGVAERLGAAHIYLATGFPEGLGLPPLEAMACGCLPVGCGGFGGWDYMKQAADFPGAYEPWWPRRSVDWDGNGLWVADNDALAAANALELAASWWRKGDPVLDKALQAGHKTALAYGPDAMADSVKALWNDFSAP